MARAVPPQLQTFVVPGVDVARAGGLQLEAVGLRPVVSPRHAAVLLIVAELPGALLDAAAVVYAQMPRPRAILALGAGSISPLPAPDVSASAGQEGLEGAAERVRELLREGAWSKSVDPFEAEVLLPKRRKREKKAPDPPKETSSAGSEHGDDSAASGSENAGMNHGGMNHGGHGGMDMGFMSMVRLTQHLPRSGDGLPMERVQAPFGPFFPGLPSGLDLTLWLDGDTVAKAEVAPETFSRGIEQGLAVDVREFAERLARLDPLAPSSYRQLALRALTSESAEASTHQRAADPVVVVELERAASHLNWLAGFAHLLGHAWLERRAAAWQLRLRRRPDPAELAALQPELLTFLRRVRRAPLLSRRLRGIGRLRGEELAGVSGPVARASGLERDARLGDSLYRSVGFETVVRAEGDALARTEVRLEEIGRSVALVLATHRSAGEQRTPPTRSASIETPRGTAGLRLRTNGARVVRAELDTPSSATVNLIERVAVGLELADALVAVASLDISPWEAAR